MGDDVRRLVERFDHHDPAYAVEGAPAAIFDEIRAGSLADRSQLYRDLADGPFFGNNRPGAAIPQGTRDAFWLQGLQAGHRNAYECIKAFSETDFTEDLKKIEVPVLVIHSEDDQIVPYADSGPLSAALLKNGSLKTYKDLPHGCAQTHPDIVNADLLAFFRGVEATATGEKIDVHLEAPTPA